MVPVILLTGQSILGQEGRRAQANFMVSDSAQSSKQIQNILILVKKKYVIVQRVSDQSHRFDMGNMGIKIKQIF